MSRVFIRNANRGYGMLNMAWTILSVGFRLRKKRKKRNKKKKNARGVACRASLNEGSRDHEATKNGKCKKRFFLAFHAFLRII